MPSPDIEVAEVVWGEGSDESRAHRLSLLLFRSGSSERECAPGDASDDISEDDGE